MECATQETKLRLLQPTALLALIQKIDPADFNTAVELLGYIDKLHSALMDYQLIVDLTTRANKNIERA